MGQCGDKNLDKVALVLIALAFQLHALCMGTIGGYRLTDSREEEEADEAVQAFLIMAFLAYTCAFMLAVLINFGNLDGQIAKIITVAACFVGAACTVIGISIYGGECVNNCEEYHPFSLTSYVTGFFCLGTGGVLMLLAMCC